MSTNEATIPRRRQGRAWRWPLGAAACLAPLIAVAFVLGGTATGLVYIGVLVTFVSLTLGPRVALGAALSVPAVVFVGLLLSNTAWAASLFMVVMGFGIVWSYIHGWQIAGTYVATQGALAVVAAPQLDFMSDYARSSVASAAVSAGFVGASALWVALLGFLLLYDLPKLPVKETTRHDRVVFGVALCLTLGVSTFVLMTFTSGGHAWWVLLTIMVVMEPGYGHTLRRSIERAGGTVLGGALAMLMIVWVHNSMALNIIGLLLAIGTAVTFIVAPYWVFATSLTMAIVVLMTPAEHAVRASYERVGYTVLAAIIAVVAAALLDFIAKQSGHKIAAKVEQKLPSVAAPTPESDGDAL